jgi:type II secretory ATPase GspE/PulE/Tfp pilus assembly ATPase PilB-like protein
VLSTLHTNDSVGAVNRLVDMGVEPYLVASSLVASLAQRLVRRICPHCKEEDTSINPRILAEIADTMEIPPEDVKAWVGRGCPECTEAGYRGRIAIFELFLLDEELRDMISSHVSTTELRRAARSRGMLSLRENGWEKVLLGKTTIEEISRITGALQISYNPPAGGAGG